jgi:putative sugar O-methyltransferase
MKKQSKDQIAEHEPKLMSLTPDDTLEKMINAMKKASPLYMPSAFWDHLAAIHMEELGREGFNNFKRTINMRYFNWGILGILRHQLLPVFWRWLSKPNLAPFRAQFRNYRSSTNSQIKSFNLITAALYKIYVAMLADFVADSDRLGLLDKITEPEVGNPFVINHRGRSISQDLCNSIHEFYNSTAACDPTTSGFRIAELGAGYGRLGQVYLSVLPSASYCVIDIPPALYVAQRYLTSVFPGESVFKFREFSSYNEIRADFEGSRIRFLAAHQIELLPPDQFDLFVNISSLHEMTREQIANYLKQIDRLCRGSFYSKQWRVSRAKENGFTIKESEYPIPSNWKEVFHRQHQIQRMFFEALYRT